MKNLFELVLSYEAEGIKREALMSLIKPQVEAIDKGRKGIREDILSQLKALDCASAVKACNAISQSKTGMSNAEKQRLSRRRSMLRNCLKETFPEYDFENSTTRKGGKAVTVIEAEYVGSEERRETIDLFSAVERLRELNIVKLPKVDIDSITKAIEHTTPSATNDFVQPAPDIKDYLDDIMTSIQSLQERKAQSVG